MKAVALGEQLAALLRSKIVRGQLEPGAHLVEDALAAEYGVSRGPVRDALRALLAEGLLESRKRGTSRRRSRSTTWMSCMRSAAPPSGWRGSWPSRAQLSTGAVRRRIWTRWGGAPRWATTTGSPRWTSSSTRSSS
nr:GntR family transcriptional regulator [Tessaracoccus coleopterorum]